MSDGGVDWTAADYDDGDYVPSPRPESLSSNSTGEEEQQLTPAKCRALQILRRSRSGSKRASTTLKKKSGFKRAGSAIAEDSPAATTTIPTRSDDDFELKERFFHALLRMKIWERESELNPAVSPEDCVTFDNFENYRSHFNGLLFEEMRASMLSEMEEQETCREVTIGWINRGHQELLQRSRSGIYSLRLRIGTATTQLDFNDILLLEMQDKRDGASHQRLKMLVVIQERPRSGAGS
jgi:hypothetical protein